MNVSYMWATSWAVCEGLPSTIEGMLHVRALPCMWATRDLYVRGSPPSLRGKASFEGITVHVSHIWAVREGLPTPLRKCYTWGHSLCTWATRELFLSTWAVCEGLPSTFQQMQHVSALLCMWATCEVHVSTWAVCEGLPSTIVEMLHVRASPCIFSTLEPHMSCTCRFSSVQHWGNATYAGALPCTWAITWLTCMCTAPLHLPHQVTKNRPSST